MDKNPFKQRKAMTAVKTEAIVVVSPVRSSKPLEGIINMLLMSCKLHLQEWRSF